MPRLPINSAVLRDVMRYRGVEVCELSKRVGVKEERVRGWLTGEALPTWRQLVRLARALHVPAGYFFLSETPPLGIDMPDYRR